MTRTYATTLPNKIAGQIVIDDDGTVRMVPPLRWMAVEEMTRSKAAEILRKYRRPYAIRRVDTWRNGR